MPIRTFNYSYIRDQLWNKYGQKVSVPTIIDRAKKNNFYFPRPKRKSHDREVLANYVGELIQHDSSWHKWSPYAAEKWHLITSLDDYSRKMLYANLVEPETSWDHIFALGKDIFCLRAERIVNPYRKISFNNLEFRMEGVPIRGTVQLRIIPNKESDLSEIRFWYENRLVDIQKVKNEDLNLVRF